MIVVQAKAADYASAVERAKGKVPDKPVVQLSRYGVKKIWDNYEVIADIYTTETSLVRISAGTVDGHRKINLREFLYYQRSGEWRPGKNGFSIPMMMPIFTEDSDVPVIKELGNEFLEAMIKAVITAETMELVDRDKSLYILRNYSRSTSIKAKEIENNENQQP